MHAEAAMNTSTGETDEDAEFGRGPLRRRGIAVGTTVVVVCFLDLEELGGVSPAGNVFLHRESLQK